MSGRSHTKSALPALVASLYFTCLSIAAERIGDVKRSPEIAWKRTQIDPQYRSEGVAVADVDRDGDIDVMVGELWYEAPRWRPHENSPVGDYGDGSRGYSNSFHCFADDINRDDWPDLIVIGFPGKPCHWYENPGKSDRHWRVHLICGSACSESPAYVDLFGAGRRVLVIATQRDPGRESSGQMAWFEPSTDVNAPWTIHAISQLGTKEDPVPGSQVFSHGLGVGDVDGDGRMDVLCTEGWWKQPAEPTVDSWEFHPSNFGESCAQMYVEDLNGDGVADVLTSSAHNYGIWAHQGQSTSGKSVVFAAIPLFPRLLSQTHALLCVDVDGNQQKDLITGKRWWAHGPDGDPGSKEPAELYWFEASHSSLNGTTFTPRLIDSDSGVGIQFVAEDVNGDGSHDIVTSSRKGVYLFEQTMRPVVTRPIYED